MTTNLERVKAAQADVHTRFLGLRGAVEVRNAFIIAAHQDGVSQADLAAAAGLSPQRISQLIYDATEDNNGDLH